MNPDVGNLMRINMTSITSVTILEAVAFDTLNAYDRKVVETLSLRRINVKILEVDNIPNVFLGFSYWYNLKHGNN